ncbi:unnamed protein product [Cochlearia groenlandica]
MEFFFEMLLTIVVALLLFARLVSFAMARNSDGGLNYPTSDHVNDNGVGDGFIRDTCMKMDAQVLHSETNFTVFDKNVELMEADQGEKVVIRTVEAEFLTIHSTANVIDKEVTLSEQGETGSEKEELIVLEAEDQYITPFSPENVVEEETMIQVTEEGAEETRNVCVEIEKSRHVIVAAESEVVEDNNNKIDRNNEEEGECEEKKTELNIEEDDDDWEGIERTELEKAFVFATNLLGESSKAEESIGVEAKMKLYGLHKIATEGSCRVAQPMAVIFSSRAKWNAWAKLGNMSQEEAMENYLALLSKVIPCLMTTQFQGER